MFSSCFLSPTFVIPFFPLSLDRLHMCRYCLRLENCKSEIESQLVSVRESILCYPYKHFLTVHLLSHFQLMEHLDHPMGICCKE